MVKIKQNLENTAYAYPTYSNKSGDYSDLLEEKCGDGQGAFNWLDYNNKNWFTNNLNNPEFIFFNGVYYKYGKDGYRKSSLNQLKKYNIK
jgi:hypothetical protein